MQIFDKVHGKILNTLTIDQKPTDALLYGTKIFILCSKEGYIDVYDTIEGKIISREKIAKEGFYSNMTLIPNENNIIITGINSKKYLVYNLETMKLTREQEYVICKLLHYSKSEEFSQFILKTIGEHNWTRNILSDTVEFLTEEQEDLYESLGGGFDSEEIDEFIYNDRVNLEISRKLREQGVTKYLCENEEYLDEIRNGSIICEGINVEEIKNMLLD